MRQQWTHTQHDDKWRTHTKKKNMTRYEQKKVRELDGTRTFLEQLSWRNFHVWRDEIPMSLSFSSNWQNIRFIYYLHLLARYLYLSSWVRSKLVQDHRYIRFSNTQWII